ncbi:hypothetical protein [Streptomyces sp. NPDC001389]|uniref:hypothetical protein n=1 Tax=Streptomyces sp. NPDC001389 TaxID=3364569 RepID=UPI00367D0974
MTVRSRISPLVGHLAGAGLLVRLGGDAECPDVHPDQVAVLSRRRDLPAFLDRHVPLGPDQAARRLGVRCVDFDAVVRLGWVAPVGSVEIDYKRQGGVATVPLYSAEDVALLPVVRPGSTGGRCAPPGRAAAPCSPPWTRLSRAGTGCCWPRWRGWLGWAGPRW